MRLSRPQASVAALALTVLFTLLLSGSASAALVSTFAGTGAFGFSGDGGPAPAAELNYPQSTALAANGDLYIADYSNFRIRKVDAQTKVISTIAGSGSGGDGGPAATAQLGGPTGLAVGPDGAIYVGDTNGVRKFTVGGTISTLPGSGYTHTVTVDGANNVYALEDGREVYRYANGGAGARTLVAGGGGLNQTQSEGRPATDADLNADNATPYGLEAKPDGTLYISDYSYRGPATSAVRKVSTSGIITTIAGGVNAVDDSLGRPATQTRIAGVYGLGLRGDTLYLPVYDTGRVLKFKEGGNIEAVAGAGPGSEPAPDGKDAADVQLNQVADITPFNGGFYVSTRADHRVLMVPQERDPVVDNPTPPPAKPAVISGPDSKTTDTSPTFTFSGQPGTTFQCSLDGAVFTLCASPITYTGLAAGKHTFAVRSVDALGRVSEAVSVAFEVVAQKQADPVVKAARQLALLTPAKVGARGREVVVGCKLDRNRLRTCEVSAYYRGKRVGAGSHRFKASMRRGAVTVKLTKSGRRAIRRLGGGKLVFKAKARDRTAKAKTLRASKRARVLPQRLEVIPAGLFASDSVSLVADAKPYFRSVAANLGKAKKVRCVGHTDSRGSRAYNKRLGLVRARVVCKALRAYGFKGKLRSTSAGESRPLTTNKTARGRYLNRRVSLRVDY